MGHARPSAGLCGQQHGHIQLEGKIAGEGVVLPHFRRRACPERADGSDPLSGRANAGNPRGELDRQPPAMAYPRGQRVLLETGQPFGLGVVAHVRGVAEKLDGLEVRIEERLGTSHDVDEADLAARPEDAGDFG